MKKLMFLMFVLVGLLVVTGMSWADVINPGPFGAKYIDQTFNSSGTIQPGNIWGVISLAGTFNLLDGNPENQNLAGLPYFQQGSNGFNYFGVYGGLSVLGPDPLHPGSFDLGPAPGIAPYLQIWQVPVADTIAGVSPYDLAVLAGPNPGGLGAPGTFGTAITAAPGATLFLELAPATGDYLFTYGIAGTPGTDEIFTVTGTTTGHTLAYWDVVGGSGAGLIQTDSFPFIPNTYHNTGIIGDADADLKIVSDLTIEVPAFGWNTSSEDPVTGIGASVPEPSTILLLGMGLFGIGIFGRKRMKK